MEDHENLYDKIRELFGQNPGNFNIMEDNIDMDLQMEYFESSRKLARKYDDNWAIDQIEILENPDVATEEKKQVLARLATINNVTVYRVIEAYAKDPAPDLKDWTNMALQESRMHLEGQLLGENQIFIST